MTQMDERIARMEGDIAETKLSQIRMENKFDEKIKALFDGQKQLVERLDLIEEKVSSHEEFILKRIKLICYETIFHIPTFGNTISTLS